MFGASITRGAVGLALLIGGSSVCLAESRYDRNLEQAVKEIVARKMKADIRGTLGANWRLPLRESIDSIAAPVFAEISPTFVDTEARLPSDSILGYRIPAMTTSAIRAAESIIELPASDRQVRVVYF